MTWSFTPVFVLMLGGDPGTQPPIVDPSWVPSWQFSYHPVTPHVSKQGDISGGLFVDNKTWHFFTSCTGGWCHLSSTDLCHWESHGIITAKKSTSYPGTLGLGTGSVLPSPAHDGSILAWVNNVNGHMVSTDGMKTWT
eukprot:gene27999-18165_t